MTSLVNSNQYLAKGIRQRQNTNPQFLLDWHLATCTSYEGKVCFLTLIFTHCLEWTEKNHSVFVGVTCTLCFVTAIEDPPLKLCKI